MFYMFLKFMSIRCYLPFDPQTYFLCIILNYKNVNLTNRLIIYIYIYISFKEKKKSLFLSWSRKQKCMKLEKKKNDIERNSTNFY